jgi:hypothetical protein
MATIPFDSPCESILVFKENEDFGRESDSFKVPVMG